MKKAFRFIALALAAVMLAATLCGCSTFVDAFIEGYTTAMNESSGSTDTNDDGDGEDDVFLFGSGSGSAERQSEAEAIFASNTGDFDASDLVGEWLDEEDDFIYFYDDGSADYFGTPVESYSFDGEFITFIYEGDEIKYPARLYDDIFVIFYEPVYYVRTDSNTGDLTGRWESSDGNDYAFEFYDDSTFTEDDEFEGNYYIDGNDILLMYSDGFINYGIFYLHEDGEQLGFAYGWPLERID